MFTISVNEHKIEKKDPITLEKLAFDLGEEAYCAKVNNRLRELTYTVDGDCTVQFLDLKNADSVVVYQTSLRYLFVMAISRLFPQARVVIKYSVSRSFFVTVSNLPHALDAAILKQITDEVDRLIIANIPITRRTLNKDRALEIYKQLGYEDKANILKYRPDDAVHFYECDGYLNYMFGYMVPSTGYLKQYRTRLYAPGFILQYPRAEAKGLVPEFGDEPTLGKALKQASQWGEMISGNYIHQMNDLVENKKDLEFINLCETKHNDMLAELGLQIKEHMDNIRLIAIAGPSSSGKTTFTNRLRIELMARGIKPVMISIDDYYFGKEQAPKDEDGNPDLEHIEALDIELFNQHIFSLIQGETVTLPHFNFETGKREEGLTISVGPNNPILIEGIHALNDRLTPSIPLHQKYKIYIAPQAQLHIDDHNPISLTDIRLLRRMVRDKKFRNSRAEDTLSMWHSVRRGEFRWIYPNQEGANYVFNSELTYELCVMKKYALPMLEAIDRNSPFFIQANRLVKFLKYFKDVEDDWVPCNSILREFIGGSSFYRK